MSLRLRLLLLLATLSVSGCTQNPLQQGQRGAFWRQPAEQPPYVAQMQELDSRNRNLDTNNVDLHTQLAKLQQQAQVIQQENRFMKQQLDDTNNQLKTVLAAKQDVEQRAETLQASMRRRGNATITANNSLKEPLANINIPGLDVRRDGDVLRMSIPADNLFSPGTAQLSDKSALALDQVAQAIRGNFSRQLIAIEAHTDATTLRGAATSLYQLSASQGLAVFQYLTQQGRLSERQVFMVTFGPNQPKMSNGTADGSAKNRRIEIVIYPETVN